MLSQVGQLTHDDPEGKYLPGYKYQPKSKTTTMYAIWQQQPEPDQVLTGIAYLDFNGDGTKQKSETVPARSPSNDCPGIQHCIIQP